MTPLCDADRVDVAVCSAASDCNVAVQQRPVRRIRKKVSSDHVVHCDGNGEIEAALDQQFKMWHHGSGDGDAKVESEITIGDWVEKRGEKRTRMMQLRHNGKAVITITVQHYGEQKSKYLMEQMKQLFVNGFTKEQLVAVKSSIAR